jgi:hypothetical protein
VREWGRPDWRWRADGTEAVNGTLCVKLVGVQQSPDWDEPRGPRRAWRRRETAWVAVRAGVAYRVERVIECKEPGRRDVAQRSVLRYDLEFSPRLPAPMGEERRRDISQALQFAESAGPLVAEPARHGPQLTALLERIDGYLERQLAATPYRDAVLAIRARVAAARRGETPPALPSELTTPTGGEKEGPTEAVLNAPAPDFLAPDWTNPAKSATLRNWRGRAVLMVFYSPTSPNLDDLMRLVQKLASKHKEVAVVALAMSGDAAAAIKQRGEKGWQFPVLDGRGLRGSYAVDGTPKLVMIDAGGVVRGTVVGWGDETAAEVAAAVPRWLRTR